MLMLTFACVCVLVFGNIATENGRLKKMNLALLKSLKELTAEAGVADQRSSSGRFGKALKIQKEDAVGEVWPFYVMEDGQQCSSGRITDENTCKEAAKYYGGIELYGKSWDGPNDTPGCIFANDSRQKLYFNTALNANGRNSAYAEICSTSHVVCTAMKQGACPKSGGELIPEVYDEDTCLDRCQSFSAAYGSGCCQWGSRFTQDPYATKKCYFWVGAGIDSYSDWWAELHEVSICTN